MMISLKKASVAAIFAGLIGTQSTFAMKPSSSKPDKNEASEDSNAARKAKRKIREEKKETEKPKCATTNMPSESKGKENGAKILTQYGKKRNRPNEMIEEVPAPSTKELAELDAQIDATTLHIAQELADITNQRRALFYYDIITETYQAQRDVPEKLRQLEDAKAFCIENRTLDIQDSDAHIETAREQKSPSLPALEKLKETRIQRHAERLAALDALIEDAKRKKEAIEKIASDQETLARLEEMRSKIVTAHRQKRARLEASPNAN